LSQPWQWCHSWSDRVCRTGRKESSGHLSTRRRGQWGTCKQSGKYHSCSCHVLWFLCSKDFIR
jgi:hypothetical protein